MANAFGQESNAGGRILAGADFAPAMVMCVRCVLSGWQDT